MAEIKRINNISVGERREPSRPHTTGVDRNGHVRYGNLLVSITKYTCVPSKPAVPQLQK